MNLYTDEPSMSDWRIATSNSEKIDRMRAKASLDYGIKQESSSPYAPDYEPKIKYCRSQIRNLEFLDYDEKRALSNLKGAALKKDVLTMMDKALEIKREYLNFFVDVQSFVTAAKPRNNFKILSTKDI